MEISVALADVADPHGRPCVESVSLTRRERAYTLIGNVERANL